MSQIPSIPTTICTIIYASLENKVAVLWHETGPGYSLQMWEFSDQHPRWTQPTRRPPSTGSISPVGNRLLTYVKEGRRSAVEIRDTSNGHLLAEVVNYSGVPRPLDITFDSEDQFSFHYDTHREPYVINPASLTGHRSITRSAKQRLEGQVRERDYRLDDSHEWVFCGVQRICWVPPEYIGSVPTSHWWVGSSLVMVGQDRALRRLNFS